MQFAYRFDSIGKMTSSCCFLVLFSLVVLTGSVHGRVYGSTIADTADKYIGSTKWAQGSWYSVKYRWGSNKCNIFVADVLNEAGGKVPQRHSWGRSPIGAGEWGNPQSTYLKNDNCWSQVFTPKRGDVIGNGRHVGIVTGSQLTTSAAKYEVVRNNWGYRSTNSGIIYWRYNC